MKLSLNIALSRRPFMLQVELSDDVRRTGLFGPSGAGKTSLLRVLAGLEPDGGEVRVDGEVWSSRSGTFRPPHLRSVGWVPQQSALFPHRSVAGNLLAGANCDRGLLDELIAILGLHSLLERRPGSLSGGEAKRVALGRALLARPRLLLLDEPLSGLDWPRKSELLSYLLRALNRFDVPAIFVSHDPFEIGVFCEQVWLLDDGRLIGTGTPEQVFLRPEGAAQALLAGVENIWRGRVEGADASQSSVRIGANRLVADYPPGRRGDGVVVVLAAAEVLLSRAAPAKTSARNIWRGRIASIALRGREVAVRLTCGESADAPLSVPLVALITPAALSELELKQGDEVYALFKASAAKVYPA